MRPLTFFWIFLVCLGLGFFSLQNPQTATISLVKGIEWEAPLSLELIIAMGVGALLAWLYSLWSKLLRIVSNRESSRKLRQQEKRIQELEKNLAKNLQDYQKNLETQQPTLLPVVEPLTHTPEPTPKELQPAESSSELQ